MRTALIAGPGGVGSSTVAAATALAASRSGRTVLVSSDPDVAHLLGDHADDVVVVRPDVAAAADGVSTTLTGLLAPFGVQDTVEAAELAALPGARSLATVATLTAVLRSGDAVNLVVDGGSSAVELLSVPELVGHLTDRLLPPAARILRGVGSLFGRSTAGPADPVGALLDRLLPGAAVLSGASLSLVTDPRPLRDAATRRLVPQFALFGLGPGRIVVNGPDRGRATTSAAVQAWTQRCPTAAVTAAPMLDDAPAGEALSGWARSVFADLDPMDVVAGPALVEPPEIPDGDGYRWNLSLPLADRADLDLVRSDDDLVLSVGGVTRRLELPSVLRRCTITGAEYTGGALSVSFVPDPARWPGVLTDATPTERAGG